MAPQPRQYPNRSYPQAHMRKPQGSSGMKTFLIIMGIMAATGFLICGGIAAFVGLGVFGLQRAEQQRQAEIDKAIADEQAALNAPPKDFDEAIIDLNKDDKARRIAVLKWLRDEPVNSYLGRSTRIHRSSRRRLP